ncbi:MAG: hypothetical protein A2Y40_08135 [Candidatus Margulisbacteria bacterium GWF2_35_9]|nr:MAG: hypothetical protein A2Y40_08135 [Candidatus Margulisbacteria bacterium GWF2_35_9]
METHIKKIGLPLLFLCLFFSNFLVAGEVNLSVAKKHVTEVEASVANMLINTDKKIFVLDVRSKAEYDQGHISGAVLIPKELLVENIFENKIYPEINKGITPRSMQAIIVYSKDGNDGLLAGYALKKKDFNFIFNIRGGFQSWQATSLNIETN